MDREEVLDQLADVAADVLGVDRAAATEDARFKEDLDADSLDLVEFVMAIEERFDISVPEEKLEGITTVGQAATLVLETAGAPAQSADLG
jgi:acyl carrier protein